MASICIQRGVYRVRGSGIDQIVIAFSSVDALLVGLQLAGVAQ